MPASFSRAIVCSARVDARHLQHIMTLRRALMRAPTWTTGLLRAVVATAVGNRLVAKLQTFGRRDGCRRRRLALPGEDVEYHVSAAGAALERLGTGRVHRLQPVLQHRREDPHELPVAVVAGRQPGSQAAERVGQLPALEGRAVAQRAGLARQDRHVMPRIVGDLAAPVARSCARQHQELRGCSATIAPSWRMTIRSA